MDFQATYQHTRRDSVVSINPDAFSIGALSLAEPTDSAVELVKSYQTIPHIPNEILIFFFSYLSVKDCSKMRLVCFNWKSIIRAVSRSRLPREISTLSTLHTRAHLKYEARNIDAQPQLAHYSTFMRQLSEAAWYNTPPLELQTVCECLCLLSVNQLPALPDSTDYFLSTPPATPVIINIHQRLSWKAIKKMMANSDFKSFILNLKTSCESISNGNIRRVESIIMEDQSITYPRLREVSTLGYRLLIVVAAVLQYHNLFWSLDADRIAEVDASLDVTNMQMYCVAVNKSDD